MPDRDQLIHLRKRLIKIKEEQEKYAKTICVASFVIICIGCILQFCFIAEENNDDIPKKDKDAHAAGIPIMAAGIASFLCIVFVHRPALGASLKELDEYTSAMTVDALNRNAGGAQNPLIS